MKISVEHSHITHGRRDDPNYCPVALAIAERTGEFPNVGENAVIIGKLKRYLPSSVQRFIASFDDGLPVEPVVFELEV